MLLGALLVVGINDGKVGDKLGSEVGCADTEGDRLGSDEGSLDKDGFDDGSVLGWVEIEGEALG
ncbi:hypothetical protein ACHAWT_004436 [Skeletonema menzelii]